MSGDYTASIRAMSADEHLQFAALEAPISADRLSAYLSEAASDLALTHELYMGSRCFRCNVYRHRDRRGYSTAMRSTTHSLRSMGNAGMSWAAGLTGAPPLHRTDISPVSGWRT